MSIVIPVLYILMILSALLLVGVVLLQKSKDSGMVAMGGGVGEALFGAQVGSFLVKATIVLGSVFLISALTLSVITSKTDKGIGTSKMRDVPASPAVPAESSPMPVEQSPVPVD